MRLSNFLKITPAITENIFSRLKPVFLYLLTSVFVAVIPFSVLAVATHYFSPAEMGVIGQYQIVLAFTVALVGFGSISSVNIKIFEFTLERFKRYCFNIFLISVLSGFFLLIASFLLSELVATYFKIDAAVLYTAVFVGFVCFPVVIALGICQSRGEVKKHGLIRIFHVSIEYGFFAFLMLLFLFESEARLLGAIISSVIISSIIVYKFYIDDFFKQRVDKGCVVSALSYGLPMVVHGVAGVLLTLGDRLVINVSLGVDELGLYLVAAQLTFALNLLYDSVFKVMHPWVVKITVGGDFKLAFLSMVCVFLMLAVIGFVCLPIFKYLYVLIYSDAFYGGVELIFPLMLALVFRSGYYGFAIFINIFSKNKLLAYNTVLSGLLVIGLSFYMAQYFGLLGVAYALAFGEGVSFILALSTSIYLYRHCQIGEQYVS